MGNNDQVQQCAERLKALADPNRLRIIKALQTGPLNVSEVANVLEMEIANASHHLRCLRDVGILETKRQGKFIYYSVSQSAGIDMSALSVIDLGCCQLNLSNMIMPVEECSSQESTGTSIDT